MAVICRILASQSQGAVVIVELIRRNGAAQKIPIARTQDFSMNLGDRIKSVAGTAVVMVNPGTQAGTFILSAQAPSGDWKHRSELEINSETTKIISRGAVSATKDIGNTTRATGATTR